MKALQMTGYGELRQNVQWLETPMPTPAANEVLIDIYAASINPIDYKIVQGETKSIMRLRLPAPLGFDASGIVKDVGSSVTKFKPGEAVFVRATRDTMGTFAESIVLNETIIAPKPANLSHIEAASIPLVGLTTVQALVDRAKAKPGQRILIHAGSGGIGTFAIQYAKYLGLHVTTTTSSKNAQWVQALGADEVICYDQENYLERKTTYDIVYDTLGKETTLESFQVIKPGGVVVSIAGVPDRQFADQVKANPVLRAAMWWVGRKVQQQAKQKNAHYYRFLTDSDGKQLADIGKLMERGLLKPVIDKVFPLEQGIEALEYTAQGRAKGKVVLQMRL